ncbi:MAG: hypothetical protein ACLSAH_19130 [Bilophila wadsworthia]
MKESELSPRLPQKTRPRRAATPHIHVSRSVQRKPVKTKTDKGEKAQRVYFLDMEKCLDPHVDREDAIVSVSEKLILTSDFGRKVELDLPPRNSST